MIDYWRRWMERWPTIADLAKADIEEVNAAWRGLGYYRRARSLLKGAQTVMGDDKFNGGLLSTYPADPRAPTKRPNCARKASRRRRAVHSGSDFIHGIRCSRTHREYALPCRLTPRSTATYTDSSPAC